MQKVQEIKIKDFKVLKNLEVEVKGNNLLLIGDNGVGKSSLIQFIEIALGKATNIPPNLLGEGEIITLKDGKQYLFKVKIKDGKSIVEITGPDGMKDNRKSALATLIGAIDFDIDEFVKLSDTAAGRKKQVEIYKGLLPIEVIEDINKHQYKIKMDEQERTETGREVTKIKGALTSSPLYATRNEIQKIDISQVQQELEAANKNNGNVDRIKEGLSTRKQTMNNLEFDMNQLMKKIETIKKEISEAEDWLGKNELIDTASLIEKINSASEQNTNYNEAQRLIKQEAELKELEESYGTFTSLIESSRQAIQNAIRDMEAPVDGLEFDDEQLIYNGIPVSISTLSTSEIIQLGCKLKMAQNPDFGVLLIEHGESLGTDRLKEIQDMAKENDWQIIMEQVERGTKEMKIEIMEG